MWTSQQMVSGLCLWWVPVESRRLRDGRRLKKYVPNSMHGASMGSQPCSNKTKQMVTIPNRV